MKCYKCGAEVLQGDKYCAVCGAAQKSMTALVEEGRRGNEQALGELYTRTYEKTFFVLKGLCKDEDTAMDLLHDSYLKAFKNLDSLENPEHFQAWIKMIAANTAKNWFKKKKPMLFSQVVDDEGEEIDPVASIADEYPDHQPEELMDKQETARLLKEILDTLSEEQRIAVTLYYYEEWDVKSIAQYAGCSEGTIKSRLNYGRKKIEEAVLSLEKKGTKLYGLAPIPFFLWLFRSQDVQAAAASAAGIFGSVIADLGKNGAAQAAGNAGAHGASQTAGNAGGYGASQTAGNAGGYGASQAAGNAGVHGASQTAANAAAQAAASAAAKGGAAAVGKGLAAKLAAVIIGGVVLGGGATAGTITYIEKTNERQQQEAAQTMEMQETEPEETQENQPPEINDALPEQAEEASAEPALGIRDDLLDNTGEASEEVADRIDVTPIPEAEPAPEMDNQPETDSETEPKSVTGNPETRGVYEPILTELRDFWDNGIDRIVLGDSGFVYDDIFDEYYEKNRELHEQYPNMNFNFTEWNDRKSEGGNAYYAYYDIDRNGRDELIIAFAQNADSIERMDIYTNDGSTPHEIFKADVNIGRWTMQKIYTDGTIVSVSRPTGTSREINMGKIADDGYSYQMTDKELLYIEAANETIIEDCSAYIGPRTEVELEWNDLFAPVSENNEDISEADFTPVDVTEEYTVKVAEFLKPFAWYLGWQQSDFVFDDYTRSAMTVQAVNGMSGMGYEEVKARCQEPMKRYFGADAKFVLKEAAEYTGTSSLYMYQIIGGKLTYMGGDGMEAPFAVIDSIQKTGKDTYQVKYEYYIFDGWTAEEMGIEKPEEYSALLASIDQGLSFDGKKGYEVTLKESDTGFIITDMKINLK